MPERHWQQETVDRWFADDGNRVHRLESHDIGETPLIVEVGGHLGGGTAALLEHWPRATIWTLEPVPEFFNEIVKRFADISNVHPCNYGLGPRAETVGASLDGYGTSTISGGGDTLVRIESLNWFMNVVGLYVHGRSVASGTQIIDLMEINIEGAEYDLLDHLLELGRQTQIRNLQVQFHDVLPDAYDRMVRIREGLSATHELTYCYDFCFENWRLRDA